MRTMSSKYIFIDNMYIYIHIMVVCVRYLEKNIYP